MADASDMFTDSPQPAIASKQTVPSGFKTESIEGPQNWLCFRVLFINRFDPYKGRLDYLKHRHLLKKSR